MNRDIQTKKRKWESDARVDSAATGFFEALAMGQSIHNASVTRVPVLCFAGLSPFTDGGEMLGSRTEFIHWLQDVPDQASIVRQYCRYSGEIRTGRNIKQMVYRAMQFAMSDPKGPSYLTAAREVLEEQVEIPDLGNELMGPVTPCALPEPEVERIAAALLGAKRPLIITGYMGRNPRTPPLLAELCDKLPISVIETVGSDVSLRSDHEAYLGVTVSTHPAVCEADVILVMDCDVPWVPTAGKPADGTKIFHLDVDPLKQQMPVFFMQATRRYKVSCELALQQLNTYLDKQSLDRVKYAEAFDARAARYRRWRQSLRDLEVPSPEGIVTVPYLSSRLRQHLPDDTVIVIEAVTNAIPIIHHLNLTKPGSLYGSGAGGLGWGGGAALGVKMARRDSFICAIVGDGTYLFSQMESVYWIARRYDVPFLLVVLNNSGWNAPKVSTLLVHSDGLASKSNRGDMNLSFEPSPDYPGIAAAAGNAWGATVTKTDQVDSTLKKAVETVQGGRCAVVEVRVRRVRIIVSKIISACITMIGCFLERSSVDLIDLRSMIPMMDDGGIDVMVTHDKHNKPQTMLTTEMPPKKTRVAIVGAGPAGMSCASALAKNPDRFDVTLFDIAPCTGGQATSISLDESRYGADWLNDGVQGGSPIFRHTFHFFRRYGYEPRPVKLQVAFGKGVENFFTNVFPSPLVDQLSGEIKKLGRVLKWIKRLFPILGLLPIKVIMKLFRFSEEFTNKMVIPIMALFLGTGNQTPNVSAALLERLFCDPNMRLWEYDPDTLLPNQPTMYTFPKLGDFYRDWAGDLASRGVDIRLNTAVEILQRNNHSITLRPRSTRPDSVTADAALDDFRATYDELVLSLPADEAKTLLGKHATWRERYVLGGVAFYNDITITHSDSAYFNSIFETRYKPDLCAKGVSATQREQIAFAERQPPTCTSEGWEGFAPMYFTHSFADAPRCIEMGFDCSNYQHQFRQRVGEGNPPLEADRHVYQTIYLNDRQKHLWTWENVDPDKIIARKWWRQFGHRWQHYLRVVPGMMFINGRNRTTYAGAWTMVNMHEIACISGLAAAHRLGAAYEPFDDFAEDLFAKYLLVSHGVRYKRRQ
ncbi:hypothetical protein ACP6JE_005217 [Aspergillus fumigatus]